MMWLAERLDLNNLEESIKNLFERRISRSESNESMLLKHFFSPFSKRTFIFGIGRLEILIIKENFLIRYLWNLLFSLICARK